MPELKEIVASPAKEGAEVREQTPKAERVKSPWPALMAVPVTALIGIVVHHLVSRNQFIPGTRSYLILLIGVMVLALLGAVVQMAASPLRKWMTEMCPIIAGAILILCIWELITSGFRLLPLPYFPSPAAVLQSMIDDGSYLTILKKWDLELGAIKTVTVNARK